MEYQKIKKNIKYIYIYIYNPLFPRLEDFVCTVLSSLFSNEETKSIFTPWKRGSINISKYGFGASVDNFGWHLFQSIVLLKPGFNCCNSFALYYDWWKTLFWAASWK